MLFLKNIDPLIFIISFGIGLFIMYISTPKPKIIYKTPNMSNVNSQIYQNDKGMCYKYGVKEIKYHSE